MAGVSVGPMRSHPLLHVLAPALPPAAHPVAGLGPPPASEAVQLGPSPPLPAPSSSLPLPLCPRLSQTGRAGLQWSGTGPQSGRALHWPGEPTE